MKFIKSIFGFVLKFVAYALLAVGVVVVLNAASAKLMQERMYSSEPAYITCYGCNKEAETVNIYFGGYSDQATTHVDHMVDNLSGANVFVDYNRWGYKPEAIVDFVVKYLEGNGLAGREIRAVGFSIGMQPATLLANQLRASEANVTLVGINPCFGASALRGDMGLESELAKQKETVGQWTGVVKDLIGWAKFVTLEVSPQQFRNYSIATVVEQMMSLERDILPADGVRTLVLIAGNDETVDNSSLRDAYISATIVEIEGMGHAQASWEPEPYLEALQELGIQ